VENITIQFLQNVMTSDNSVNAALQKKKVYKFAKKGTKVA